MLASAEKIAKVISTLVFVFLAGAVTGALSMKLGLHEKLHRTVSAASVSTTGNSVLSQTQSSAGSRAGRDAILQKFKTELNLSPDQTEKIAVVLDDYRNYFDSLRE